MAKVGGPWRDGRRAWERLARWYVGRGTTPPDDDDPLAALSDVGVLRRLLDEAELEAVRAARRRGRSWAEIATKLGVTRQSAWERWRDLDSPAAPSAEGTAVEAAARDVVTAGRARRDATVTVPRVVGMTFENAVVTLANRGLVGRPDDPDAVAPDLFAHAAVTDQSPESGARVAPGSAVRLWVDRGGDAGVRAPRRPRPTPLTGRKMLDEPSEDLVG
jgi:transposase-like protein